MKERSSSLFDALSLDNSIAALGTSRCLFGENKQIKQICEVVRKIARSSGVVLIRGESGTGKEILARAIHLQSPRADKPFLAVNAGAIPPELFESELFGHRKGSFTGADRDRIGKFDEANGGTLFLDEIGDLPLAHQVKLLRVLQTGEVQPVGESRPHRVDTRVVAATNRDLEAMVKAGKFREDLYFRLNLFTLTIPPLRERREDILPLAMHFLKVFAQQQGRTKVYRLSSDVERLLLEYPWPGNIRELENCIHFAVTMTEGDIITLTDLPDHVRLCRSPFAMNFNSFSRPTDNQDKTLMSVNSKADSHEMVQKDLEQVLESNLSELTPKQQRFLSYTSEYSNTKISSGVVGDSTSYVGSLSDGVSYFKLPSKVEEILPLEQIEQTYVMAAYKAAGQNKTRTARLLGISLRSLQMKLKSWGAK